MTVNSASNRRRPASPALLLPLCALLLFLLGTLLPDGLSLALARSRFQQPESPPPTEISFQPAGSFAPGGGLALDACWLDSNHLLVLSLGPAGAELLKVTLQPRASEVLVSSEFLSANVCPAALHDRLRLKISPGGRFLALQWFTDSGQRQLALLSFGAQTTTAAPPPEPAPAPPPASPVDAASDANNAVLEKAARAAEAAGASSENVAPTGTGGWSDAAASGPGDSKAALAATPGEQVTMSIPSPDFSSLTGADVQPFGLSLPAGMQVQQLLFSPDDRYLVLAHDGFKEGSDCSLLVLDLRLGRELWRLDPGELNFIHALWWNSSAEHEGFAVSAEVHDGQFQAGPGIARFNLDSHQWDFSPEPGNLLLFGEADWGTAAAYQSSPGAAAPYHLKYSPRGGLPSEQKGALLLNSEPVDLELLPDSGYALLVNRAEASESQLWQVNLNTAKRYPVDSDCLRCELLSHELLLVVGARSNEVRIYRLRRPAGGAGAKAVKAAGAPAPGQPVADTGRDAGADSGSPAQGSTASSG